MRALCLGDLHAGAHLGYGRTPQDRLDDQELTLNRCVDLALEHDADAVFLLGDLWDARKPSPSELMAVARPLRRLNEESNAYVLGIAGNHCVESADKAIALELFSDILEVHRTPQVWDGGQLGCAIVTLPWAPGVNRLVAARDGGDRDETHDLGAALLLKAAADLRAQVDGPAALLLHWSISGASTPTGILTDEFSEVVVPLEGLEQLGFDAVIAGHIHKAQAFEETVGWTGPFMPPAVNSPFLYVGSPAPVDFSEGESAHGCWLLDVGDGPTAATFLPIESRPFITLDLETDEAYAVTTGDSDFSARREYAGAVIRVRYRALEEEARWIDNAAITAALYDAGAHKVWQIEARVERASRARVEVAEDLTPLAAYDLWSAANDVEAALATAARARLAEHLEAVA